MAIRVGDYNSIRRIGIADWCNLARTCSLEEGRVLVFLTARARVLSDAISTARELALTQGLSASVMAPRAQQLIKHVAAHFATITGTAVRRN